MNQVFLIARTLPATAAGLLLAGFFTVLAPASAQAQAPTAEQLCTPDVMRLCSEFIPDRGTITSCLRRKVRQLSPGCRTIMAPAKAKKSKKTRQVRKRSR